MQRKRLGFLTGAVMLAGGVLYLLLSALTAQAVITSVVHTTVDDFTPGAFYHTGMTQQGDGEVALLQIGIAGEWITANVEGLPPVYGHAMVEHDGYVYVLGGRIGTALDGVTPVLTRSVYMSHINTETHMLEPFTATTPLTSTAYPDGVYMHSAVVVSDHLYVIGGDVLNGYQSIPTHIVVFATFNADGTLGEWQFGPQLPDLRSRAPAVVLNGHVYLAGGKNDIAGGSSATNTVFYAPLDSNGVITQWMNAAGSLPYSPLGHMVAAYNGRLYVMGGFDGGQFRTYVYFATPLTTTGNIASGGWVSTTPMQRGIMGGAGLAFNGELFGLGGVDNVFGNAVDYARSALLDLDSGHVITFAEGQGWYDAPALDPYRVWHAAVTSRDYRYIYVLGGTTGSLSSPIADSMLNRGSTTGGSGTHGYARSGWYIGPQIELGRDRKVLSFNWTASIPATAVTMTLQYRIQNLAGEWDDWSTPIPPSGTLGLITTTIPFTDTRAFRFQYRATMTTTAPLSYTPYLHRFELVYDVPRPPEFQKQAGPPSGHGVLPGQRITYTLSFTNPNDISPLRNVVVTDTLPPYLAYVPGSMSVTAGIVSDTSGLPELRWQIGSLATGGRGDVSFVAVVSNAAPVGSWLDNKARFMSDDTEDVTSYTSHPVAELRSPVLNKTVVPISGLPVLSGQMLTYTLQYSNPNSSLPLEIMITDALPVSTTFGWCDSSCGRVGNELHWRLGIAPSSQGQVRFGVVAAQEAVSGTVITNIGRMVGCVAAVGVCTAEVASNATVNRVADPLPPKIGKLANPPSGTAIVRGSQINYTLVYTNSNQAFTLTGLTITDALPSGVQLVAGSCSPGCIMNSGVLTWTVGALAPGQQGQVSFAAQVAQGVVSGTRIVNTGHGVGCVRPGRCSSSIASNSTIHIAVTTGGVGQISKVASPSGGSSAAQPAIVSLGSLITYTLIYTNPNSSTPLTTVVISDVLPANTSFVACTGGCSHSSTVVRWTFTSIMPKVSGQVKFTVRINPSAPNGTPIQNQATLASDQGRINSNAVYHRAFILYDLKMTGTNRVTVTLPASTFTYTLSYTNSGPLQLSGVVITDYLGFVPSGEASAPAMPYLTVLRSSPGWQLVQSGAAGNTYRYNVGMLGPNKSGVLTMVVQLSSTVPYTVNLTNNRAIITDDGTQGYDTNTANQSPSISRPIQGPDLAISNVRISPGPYILTKPFVVTATITNRGPGTALTWQHMITPSDSLNNWFAVELYAKTSGVAPTGPHDHQGGYCSAGVTPCDERVRFLSFVDMPNGLAPGSSVVARWTVYLTTPGTYALYAQMDSGFWWLDDPTFGRVLEHSEMDNIVSIGSVSTGKNIYLPIVMRH